MRTKTLALMAAIAAAGLASASAQVFSVNIVGYVTVTLQGNNKFTMISNPLNAATNTLEALFGDNVPANTAFYKFTSSGFSSTTKTPIPGVYSTSGVTLVPGEGVFVLLPAGSTNTPITFTGEVQQGTLTNVIPAGFSIVSSRVPQASAVSVLGLTGSAGDVLYQWNATTQAYVSINYVPPLNQFQGDPTIQIGEAFFLSRGAAGNNWVRTFNP